MLGDNLSTAEAGEGRYTALRGARVGTRAVLLFSLMLATMVGFSVSAHQYERFPGDLPVANWVQSISLPLFGGAMELLSELGHWTSAVAVTAVVVVLLWFVKRRSDAMCLLLITLGSTVANRILKELVDRPRPSADLVEVVEGLSSKGFPSGHVVYAVIFYGLLLFYSCTFELRPRWVLRIGQAALVGLILGMGLSRVYLGVHWPSDVLGGYTFGGVLVLMVIWLRWTRILSGRAAAKSPFSEQG